MLRSQWLKDIYYRMPYHESFRVGGGRLLEQALFHVRKLLASVLFVEFVESKAEEPQLAV